MYSFYITGSYYIRSCYTRSDEIERKLVSNNRNLNGFKHGAKKRNAKTIVVHSELRYNFNHVNVWLKIWVSFIKINEYNLLKSKFVQINEPKMS